MPDWDLNNLRAAIDAAGVGLWSWNVETDAITMDPRAHALWGVDDQARVTFSDLSAKIHPRDLDRVRAGFAATRAIVGPYEMDFRILSGDDLRWISTRGQGNDADIRHNVMRGIFLDVTGRKQAEEAHELLAGEMSHRVKNLLLVASQLARITSHSAGHDRGDGARPDPAAGRAWAGRMSSFTREAGQQKANSALLGDLLTRPAAGL